MCCSDATYLWSSSLTKGILLVQATVSYMEIEWQKCIRCKIYITFCYIEDEPQLREREDGTHKNLYTDIFSDVVHGTVYLIEIRPLMAFLYQLTHNPTK